MAGGPRFGRMMERRSPRIHAGPSGGGHCRRCRGGRGLRSAGRSGGFRGRARMSGGTSPSIRQSGRSIRPIGAGAAAISAAISGSRNRHSSCERKLTASYTSGSSQPGFLGSGSFGGACPGRFRGGVFRGRGTYRPAATRAARAAKRCFMPRSRSTIRLTSGCGSRLPPIIATTAWVSQWVMVAKRSAGVGVRWTRGCFRTNDEHGQLKYRCPAAGRRLMPSEPAESPGGPATGDGPAAPARA